MPKNDSVSSTATTVTNPHAMELTGPVEDEFLSGTPEDQETGSHQEDDATTQKTDEVADEEEGGEVPEAEVPVRLRGKTKAQIYKEFAGLEKDYSRQGNELGEARGLLRQTLETILDQQQSNVDASSDDDATDEDLSSPEGVRKLVKKELAPVEARAATAEQKLLMIDFNDKHPGYLDTVKTPEFQEFVKASPYRTRLFKAAAAFDMEAAEDLFSAYEETVKATTEDGEKGEDKEDPTLKKRQALRRASTETGSAGKGASGKGGKKIWKSVEIHRLYNNDREKYNELMPEIQNAYREGRVK